MLWAWGTYKNGQLGIGEVNQKCNPRLVQTLYNTSINKVACGGVTTIAVIGDSRRIKPAWDLEAQKFKYKAHFAELTKQSNFGM